MDYAQARLQTLSLDPKRIAATSLAIAVHVAVLMLLMLPAQIAPSKTVVDNPMIMVPKIREIPIVEITRPPLAPTNPSPRPPAVPQAAPVDTTPSPIDTYVPPAPPEIEIIESYQPDPTPAFVQISADIAPPPPYPAQALRLGITGVVTLKVRVDNRGQPVDAVVESSSGSRLLDGAALKHVLAHWHFIPAMQNGVPIEAYALVPISFVKER
jgi:protein TonB